MSADELLWRGQRGYNLEKAFNTIHTDWERAANYPPARFFEEPITKGPYAGRACDRAEWDRMLDRFYELHGWDVATSLQTRETLTGLALEDVAEMIAATGKLKEATAGARGGAA
jgi:aldehyde:ferredoxin oxidoreductase